MLLFLIVLVYLGNLTNRHRKPVCVVHRAWQLDSSNRLSAGSKGSTSALRAIEHCLAFRSQFNFNNAVASLYLEFETLPS